ncbi:hypothetical protein ACJRO7_013537 [Eucalyptus globulus]|uniref:Uncharacterized protein n=1 Tax=Eucalyptus globulus TaxID=34317 RepID=A0ABD3L376_EUCGL
MKPSLLIPLLLLSLLLFQAQGIRLSRDLASLVGHQKLPDHVAATSQVKLEVDSVRSKAKRASRASEKSSDGFLPSIHEDYYGPRNHKPRHHKH